jgi:hypothetical protein
MTGLAMPKKLTQLRRRREMGNRGERRAFSRQVHIHPASWSIAMKVQQLIVPTLVILGGAMLGRLFRLRTLGNMTLATAALAPAAMGRKNASRRARKRPMQRKSRAA